MAKTKKEKEITLAQISDDLKKAKGVVFTEYRGMTVKEIDKLRKILRKEKVKYQVIKMTLLKKAFAALGIDFDSFKYSGPVAMALSQEDETAAARVLKGLSKEQPMLVIDGGIFNGELIGSDIVSRLASLPTKEQLLGQLLSVISGPARGLVTVLSGNTRNLLNVLNAIKDKK